MTTCFWCASAGVVEIEVEPAEYRTVKVTKEIYGKRVVQSGREVVHPQRMAWACAAHCRPALHGDPVEARKARKADAKAWARRQGQLV